MSDNHLTLADLLELRRAIYEARREQRKNWRLATRSSQKRARRGGYPSPVWITQGAGSTYIVFQQ